MRKIVRNAILCSTLLLSDRNISEGIIKKTHAEQKDTYTCSVQIVEVSGGNVTSVDTPNIASFSFNSGNGIQIFEGKSLGISFVFAYNDGRKVGGVASIGGPMIFEGTVNGDEIILRAIKPGTILGYVTTCKKDQIVINNKFSKAVFIRPCARFYSDYEDVPNGELKTKVGGGTLSLVCQDLKDSGVSDVYLPFKVDTDDSKISCGYYGQLLYRSDKYPEKRSEIIKDKFDPNRAIIDVCKSIYGTNTIRFHAWFPVFKDPYAAQIQGIKGALRWDDVQAVLDDVSTLPGAGLVVPGIKLSDGRALYKSNLFAEPANAQVVQYELGLLEEIVAKFPELYGINLDYIRYPEKDDVIDVKEIKKQAINICKNKKKETEPQECVKSVNWKINSNAVSEFVKKVKLKFPNHIISGDIFSNDDSRKTVAQNKVPKNLGLIMPMTYTYFGMKGPDKVMDSILEIRRLFPGIPIRPCLRGWGDRITDSASKGLLPDLADSIAKAKEADTEGYAIFTYEELLLQANARTLSSIKSQIGF